MSGIIIPEKKVLLNDKPDINDTTSLLYPGNGIKRTEVIVKNPITGAEIERTHNKIIADGSLFTAKKHFNRMAIPVTLPNYNNELTLDNIKSDWTAPEEIFLFCAGVEDEVTIASEPDPTKWIKPANLLPFRRFTVSSGKDLTPVERNSYFGKKTGGTYIDYYFKSFEADPVCYPQFTDGTQFNSSLYTIEKAGAIEVMVELQLKVLKTDFRDYFKTTSSIDNAKVNTFSLCSASYTTGSDGYRYYQNIRPITKVYITTEKLNEETKGLDIIYRLYY